MTWDPPRRTAPVPPPPGHVRPLPEPPRSAPPPPPLAPPPFSSQVPAETGPKSEKDKDYWPPVRDLVLFVAGLVGVGHEVLLIEGARLELLILFAAMMGLPAVFRLPKDDS